MRYLLVLAVFVLVAPGVARADVPPPPQGYSLVWSDDFSGAAGTGLDASSWLYDTGTKYPCGPCPSQWGTGEVETMTSSTANVFQDGLGHLVIKALKGAGGPTSGWTSGRVETQRTDFAAPDSGIMRVQASIQLPDVASPQGYWPAFWMLGAPFRGTYTNWPAVGELDIMENIDGLNTDWGTLHCGVAPGGPCNEFNGRGGTTPGGSPSLQSAYHTYAIELDRSSSPQQLRWYLDGVRFFSVRSTDVDAQTWENATHHGFFVILDLAMGGGFPGAPTAATTPGGELRFDYVAVYTSVRSASSPGAVSGSVPATLSLSLGAPASFGAFVPGVARDYTASMTANVLSTAADASLSVADPASFAPGHLVNGPFSLPSALVASASSPAGVASAGGAVSGAPLPLETWSAPVSNDPVTLAFKQSIAANDALRTGSYAKTLTFTLSTTTP